MSGSKKLNLIIDENLCNQCGLCTLSCIQKAIDIKRFQVNNELCFGCSHCVSVCPQQAIKFDNIKLEKLNDITINKEAFINLIFKRSSHRNYLDKPIPKEVIYELAEIVRFSPTATNSQTVYLTVINNKEKVKKFSDHVMKYFRFISYFFNYFTFLFFIPFFGYKNTKKLFRYKKQVNRYFNGENILTFNAPCLIFFHSPKNISRMPQDDCNIAATITNLYLESIGLSACFIGFIVNAIKYNKKLKKKANIPKNHNVYAVLTVGYPRLKYLNKKIREPFKLQYIS